VDDRLLDGIDLAPTMLAIAGAPKPPKMQGRNFLGDRAEPPREYVFGSRDRCDETVMQIRSVRDERYRYIRNFTPGTPFLAKNRYVDQHDPGRNLLRQLHAEGKLTPPQEFLCQSRMPDEELYDLQTDPWETRNLASLPEQAETLKRLRGVLEKWIEDVNDHGRPAGNKQKGK
jgi:arylsulfatase A-like enzyme